MRVNGRKMAAAIMAALICLTGFTACGAKTEEEPTAQSAPVEGMEEEDIPEDAAVSEDRIPMVMVDGTLYLDTGKESDLTARCGMMDGEITSAVDASEIPSENGQSNFGSGYGWQYGEGDTIEIHMDGKWMVFRAQEE